MLQDVIVIRPVMSICMLESLAVRGGWVWTSTADITKHWWWWRLPGHTQCTSDLSVDRWQRH